MCYFSLFVSAVSAHSIFTSWAFSRLVSHDVLLAGWYALPLIHFFWEVRLGRRKLPKLLECAHMGLLIFFLSFFLSTSVEVLPTSTLGKLSLLTLEL